MCFPVVNNVVTLKQNKIIKSMTEKIKTLTFLLQEYGKHLREIHQYKRSRKKANTENKKNDQSPKVH